MVAWHPDVFGETPLAAHKEEAFVVDKTNFPRSRCPSKCRRHMQAVMKKAGLYWEFAECMHGNLEISAHVYLVGGFGGHDIEAAAPFQMHQLYSQCVEVSLQRATRRACTTTWTPAREKWHPPRREYARVGCESAQQPEPGIRIGRPM